MKTRKSVWSEMTLLKVLFCWLIVPVLVAVIVAKNYKVEITPKTLKVTKGVFSKSTKEYAVAGITEINVDRTFGGRLFRYGSINVSLAGSRNVTLESVLHPEEVKKYLEQMLLKTSDVTHILAN